MWLAFLCLTAGAAGQVVSEYQVKAAYLYNFAKFVEWPAEGFSSPADSFEVCIFGEDPFGAGIDELMHDKVVQQRKLVLRRIASFSEARSCQILFVPRASRAQTRELLEQIKSSSILTVGETPDFLRNGGVINLVLEQDRVRFDVNLDAAQRTRLRISSKLLAVARAVHNSASR